MAANMQVYSIVELLMENIAGFPWRLYEAQSTERIISRLSCMCGDINDDYIKLLQMAMSHTLDSVALYQRMFPRESVFLLPERR